MDRENTVIIAAVIFILAIVMFSSRETETTEPQLVKIGVLTNKETNASDIFLASQAINDVNQYCLNKSLPFQFTPVYKCNQNSPKKAKDMKDEFHREDVSIIVGYHWGSTLDTCDYQSRNYGMVIVSPYSNTAVNREVYRHIFQLTPMDIHETQVVARIMVDLGYMETTLFAYSHANQVGYIVEEFKAYYEVMGGRVNSTLIHEGIRDEAYVNEILSKLEDVAVPNIPIIVAETFISGPYFSEIHNHPSLLNHTWFATSHSNWNYTDTLSAIPELAEIELIHPTLDTEPDQSNPKYQALNSLYYAEFGENMTRYTGNVYDAVWLSALTVIQTGEYNNRTFIETFPEVAQDYNGVSGNCSLDQYGDRLHAGYNIYKFVLRGENVYLKEIGYCDTSQPGIQWTELQ